MPKKCAVGRQLPAEAQPVVMRIDTGAAEAVAGEALLHAFDHGVDAGAAVALHHRIEMRRRPSVQARAITVRPVGLVPHGDVAVDESGEIGGVGHAALLRGRGGASAAGAHDPAGMPLLSITRPVIVPRYTSCAKIRIRPMSETAQASVRSHGTPAM